MAKKNLNQDESKETIDFTFDGINYREEIKQFKVTNLTPLEVRQALNEVPAKHAYWASKLADVNLAIEEEKIDYDMWYAKKYTVVVDKKEGAKSRYVAEGSKKNEVLINNPDEYKRRMLRLRELAHVKEKMEACVKSFDIQSRTLQSIASLMRAEMANISGSDS